MQDGEEECAGKTALVIQLQEQVGSPKTQENKNSTCLLTALFASPTLLLAEIKSPIAAAAYAATTRNSQATLLPITLAFLKQLNNLQGR